MSFEDQTGRVEGRVDGIPKTAIVGILVPPRVHTKFYDFVAKGRLPQGATISEAFFRSQSVTIFPEMRQALCHVLRMTEPDAVWIRSRRFSNTFTLVMIGEGMKVVEVCGYRALRQMGKAFLHYLEEQPKVMSEDERYHRIWKFKRTQKIGGGLIRQETQPRDRFKKK